jgi:inositol phosphorylceramide mannosyltransferase catalytic subunit
LAVLAQPGGEYDKVSDRQVGIEPSVIERNIFQTWKSKSELPANFRYWRSTVIDLNPEFKQFFWDDADNRAFLATHYPWFLETYDAYPLEIYRADAVRYFWLYHFGGIYVDIDTECLRPLSDLCTAHGGVVLGRMGDDDDFVHSIPNAVMASSARHAFWLYVFHLLMSPRSGRTNPEDLTGSIMLKSAVDMFLDGRHAADVGSTIESIKQRLPPEHFFPVNWANPIHERFFRKRIIGAGNLLPTEKIRRFFPRSMLVTYWAHSWTYPPGDSATGRLPNDGVVG